MKKFLREMFMRQVYHIVALVRNVLQFFMPIRSLAKHGDVVVEV